MNSKFGPKHQRHVNECYPQSNGNTGAISGKISSLVYYINAKPSKLLKVSAYLERKTIRDIYRESAEYNIVTLEIIEGIMRGCVDYYYTFAPTVVKVLFLLSKPELFSKRSVELASKIHQIFLEFCRLNRSVLPSIRDGEFFELLTETYNRIFEMKVVGNLPISPALVANDLLAVVTMEDFRAPRGEARVSIIINKIFWQLYSVDAAHISPQIILQRDRSKRPLSTFEYQVGVSFIKLTENSNSTSIPIIIASIFREFDSDGWSHQKLCTNLLNLLALSIPAQFICVLLSEFFKRLERAEDNVVVILMDTISELLLSNRSPMGYSAIELATNFIKILRKQRPHASEEPRTSFIATKIPLPRTIFSIGNVLVSLIKNANFALQKYEIIEHLISKAYFPSETAASSNRVASSSNFLQFPNQNGGFADIGIHASGESIVERHNVGTVILNSTEESHFQSVVWGILNALADQSSAPNALRLSFVEIHVRLFEQLFQMSLSFDPEFCLNSLVLWKRLLENGLSVAPMKRINMEIKNHSPPRASSELSATASKYKSSLQNLVSSNDCSTSVIPMTTDPAGLISRTSLYLLTKSRAIMITVCKKLHVTVLHYAAIFTIVEALLRDCDFTQLAYMLNFILWLHSSVGMQERFTFQDRVCISMLTAGSMVHAGCLFGIDTLKKMGEEIQTKMKNIGVEIVGPDQILDLTKADSLISGYKQFDPADLIPSPKLIYETVISGINDDKSKSAVYEIFGQSYTSETDGIILNGIQATTIENGSMMPVRGKHKDLAENAGRNMSVVGSATTIFSKISQLRSNSSSIITAPAYYRTSSKITQSIPYENQTNTIIKQAQEIAFHVDSSASSERGFSEISSYLGPNDTSLPSSQSACISKISGDISDGHSVIIDIRNKESKMSGRSPGELNYNSSSDFLDVNFEEISSRVKGQKKRQLDNRMSLLSTNKVVERKNDFISEYDKK